MDYYKMSKEELIKRISELELLNENLLKEKEQVEKLNFAWTGNLGHWYWNVETNRVTYNPLKVMVLGYSREEVPKETQYQFFTDRLHPEDYERTMDAMRAHLRGEVSVYEVEYRIKAKDGSWKSFYDRGRITKYDKDGNPLFLSGIVFDITEKNQLQDMLIYKNKILEDLSMVDELTNLRNRRAIMTIMGNAIHKAISNKIPLSIVMFDIDGFKKINDTRGHLVGDEILKKVSHIMVNNTRKEDTVGRYGGEEFIVILPNTDRQIATDIANRIRLHIMEYDFIDGLKITISGGVKEYEGEDILGFIRAADKNLYTAKYSGKNKIINK